jgi:Fic family protein
MIFTAGALSRQEADVLGRIDEILRRFGHVLQSPRVWHGLLRRVTLAQAVRGSNSIEGYVVTVDDAIAAAENQPPLEAAEETWAAVQGYQQAMTYVLQLADDPHFAFSVDLMRSLHYMMVRHDLTRWPGRWRPGAISVLDQASAAVVYQGPGADEVPGLMAELADSLNTGDGHHSIVRAAMAHLNLVMIHPFRDGNGRMGRCLQTLVLARTGILAPPFSSIEEYLGRNTAEYYRVLSEVGAGAWQPRNSARPWIRFCLTAHYRQATTLLGRMENTGRLWDALESEIGAMGLHERTLFAVADAAIGLRVRNGTYRSAADISAQLASRDLKALADAGLLLTRGEKRGRFYVASPAVQAVRDRVWVHYPTPDPFENTSPPLQPSLAGLG